MSVRRQAAQYVAQCVAPGVAPPDRATVAAHLSALDDRETQSLYRDLSARLAVLLAAHRAR